MENVDQAIANMSEDTLALYSGTLEDDGLLSRIRQKRPRLELVREAEDFVRGTFEDRVSAAYGQEDAPMVIYEPREPPQYRVTDTKKRQAVDPSAPQTVVPETLRPFNEVIDDVELIDESISHYAEHGPVAPGYYIPGVNTHDEL